MQIIFLSLKNNLIIFSPEVHIIYFKLANLYRSEETGYAFPSPPSTTQLREYLHTFRTPVVVKVTTGQGQHSAKLSARFQKAEAWCPSFIGTSTSRQELTVNAHQDRGLGKAV